MTISRGELTSKAEVVDMLKKCLKAVACSHEDKVSGYFVHKHSPRPVMTSSDEWPQYIEGDRDLTISVRFKKVTSFADLK